MSTPDLVAISDFANFKVKALNLFLVSAIFGLSILTLTKKDTNTNINNICFEPLFPGLFLEILSSLKDLKSDVFEFQNY